MKLLVLGATGGIGRHLVTQSLARGHEVTALVRSPDALRGISGNLRVVQGNLLDADQIGGVLASQEAVLSAFGPRNPGIATIMTEFARALVPAMSRSQTKRLIAVTTAYMFEGFPMSVVKSLLFFRAAKGISAFEEVVRASNLDWTLVRPPRLTNSAAIGSYRAQEGRLPSGGSSVHRSEVADFMVHEAEEHRHSRQIIGIAD